MLISRLQHGWERGTSDPFRPRVFSVKNVLHQLLVKRQLLRPFTIWQDACIHCSLDTEQT